MIHCFQPQVIDHLLLKTLHEHTQAMKGNHIRKRWCILQCLTSDFSIVPFIFVPTEWDGTAKLHLIVQCIFRPDVEKPGQTKLWSKRKSLLWVESMYWPLDSKTIHQSFPRLGNACILAWAPRCSCVFLSHCRCQYHAGFPSSKSEKKNKQYEIILLRIKAKCKCNFLGQ